MTIKKAVFENLKNCSDTFSNQILNKFFGIEDNEEESQQDYQSNIQPSDINIAKFKAANEFHSSIIRAFSYVSMIIIIGIFILFILFSHILILDQIWKKYFILFVCMIKILILKVNSFFL